MTPRYALVLFTSLTGAVACGGHAGSIATNEIPGKDGGGVAGADAAGGGFPGSGGSGGAAGTAGAGGTAGQGGAAGTAGAGGSGGSPCNPGDTQDVGSCSKCGTKRQTCDSTGKWGPTQCVGQGACAPGKTQTQSCDGCGDNQTRTCKNNCTWGNWGACPGCNWNNGSNWRCCAAGSWQFCLSTCQWSSACSANANASCCTGPGPSC